MAGSTLKRRVGRPTRQDAAVKTTRLLEVATESFVKHGFDGTTMEAIAQAANMGKQAVYMRYANKESLFLAVLDQLKVGDGFDGTFLKDSLPLLSGFPKRVEGILAHCARSHSVTICGLALREGHRFPNALIYLRETVMNRFVVPLLAYIETAKSRDEIGTLDGRVIVQCVLDLIFAEITRLALDRRVLTDAEIQQRAKEMSDILLHGILAKSS